MAQLMSETIKIEESSGNVFLDIGFPEEEAERLLLRSTLAGEIYSLIGERKLAPEKVERLLGVDAVDVTRLNNADFDRFSIEQLFTFLNRLDCDVELRVTRAENTGGHQRVVLA